ncbi:MAG TPA: phosphotransferase [Rhodanobacteraceae bacterium]|nr:phosphotransferase [Rhodanobacteraceae bacterium]
MSTSPARAHGLAGELARADWPALELPEVERLLQAYPDVGRPARIAWYSQRPLSAAALVKCARGVVFVKRHHTTVRSAQTLAEEHRFIAHLRQHGVPIPAVLQTSAGATTTAMGDWVYEVHARAIGNDLYRERMSWVPPDEAAHARAAGRALARLHRAALDYRAPQRRTHVLVARSEILAAVEPVAALDAQLPERPGLAEYLSTRDWRRDLAQAIAPWHASVQPRLARQAALWTHGDWHVSNLCWNGSGANAQVSAILDFGLCARNFALFDLATAIERNAIAWLEPEAERGRPHIAQALIEGYRSERVSGTDDATLLANLLPIVHVDFALSEVEYYHAVTRSDANADVAYDAFLRGHAAWFRTAPGRALLAAIGALI